MTVFGTFQLYSLVQLMWHIDRKCGGLLYLDRDLNVLKHVIFKDDKESWINMPRLKPVAFLPHSDTGFIVYKSYIGDLINPYLVTENAFYMGKITSMGEL